MLVDRRERRDGRSAKFRRRLVQRVEDHVVSLAVEAVPVHRGDVEARAAEGDGEGQPLRLDAGRGAGGSSDAEAGGLIAVLDPDVLRVGLDRKSVV
jgi:hypothetical protein